MILIISTCKEKLHENEFVKPIEILLDLKYEIKSYKDKINPQKYEKIIISGTSLKDNDFLKYLSNFKWIENFDKPLLGICAGMQIISLINGAKLKQKKEIGFFKEFFKKKFFGLEKEEEVYHLHNNFTTLPKNFLQFNDGNIPQAIKHKEKNIFGILFHPEVRNKNLILNFLKKETNL